MIHQLSTSPARHRVIFIMGVSGSGKTTIGDLLAAKTGIPFYDGDEFHSPKNREKMQKGQALTDRDRAPWLTIINEVVIKTLEYSSVIITCSALKEVYRKKISKNISEQSSWIYLSGSYETILQRIQDRSDHYMPPTLLRSQFDIVEEPTNALKVSVEEKPDKIVNKILQYLTITIQEFGLIGLGVMGKSLSRNFARNGISLSLYNRYVPIAEEKVAQRFIEQYPELANAKGFEDIASFVASLTLPRKIFMMVPAGEAVDEMINELLPYLYAGDVLIDGGNSHYKDTERRYKMLQEININYLGVGISGGEQGALNGPSIMPGGDMLVYNLIEPYLEKIAAKNAIGACCTYIGRGGSGHFVKMVHNGIEYAEMQLIAEVYDILRTVNKLNPDEIAAVLTTALKGPLNSYLLEITIPILQKKEGDGWLINSILDKAGNKGTGGWTSTAAAELGVPVPTITAALYARYQSEMKTERVQVASVITTTPSTNTISVDQLLAAYQLSRIINHHQGFKLIRVASEIHKWNVPMAMLAVIWTNGCIIRSKLMEQIAGAFATDPKKPLLQHKEISEIANKLLPALTITLATAAEHAVPVPCLSSAAQFLYGYMQANSSANIIQAQRDYFGAHTYKRKDDDEQNSYHTNWAD